MDTDRLKQLIECRPATEFSQIRYSGITTIQEFTPATGSGTGRSRSGRWPVASQ